MNLRTVVAAEGLCPELRQAEFRSVGVARRKPAPRPRPAWMRKRHRVIQSAIVVLLAATPGARADPKDVLNLTVATALGIDQNLFHLPPGFDAARAGIDNGGADRITTDSAELKIDKSWSLQHVVVDFNIADTRYDSNPRLNAQTSNYRGSWAWQITPRLTGTLTAAQQQALASYTDFRLAGVRNLQTSYDRHFDLDWWASGPWHLFGGFDGSRFTNEVAFVQQASVNQNALDAGVRYVARSNNEVSLFTRETRGDYPGRVVNLAVNGLNDSSYSQQETVLASTWSFAGKSTLNAQIDWVRRRYPNFYFRDFSQPTGRLAYSMDVTGQLQLRGALQRDANDFEDYQPPYYTSSYVTTDTALLGATYSLRQSVVALAQFEQVRRAFRGELFQSPLSRRDADQILQFELDWAPTRVITVSANAQRDLHGSNVPGFEFKDLTFGISLRMNLGRTGFTTAP